MVGYPQHLNTKDDYEFVRKNFPKSEWENDFKKLLTSTKEWFNVGEIPDGEPGIEDDDHMVASDTQTGKRYQYERRDNPNSLIYRIGYTIDEVKNIIGNTENQC